MVDQADCDIVKEAGALFDEAGRFLDGESETVAACRRAIARARDACVTILVAGLRSTGKSSLVSVLWGDSELLPTAVRDCTQTNTLIRAPRGGDNVVDPTSPRGGDNVVDPTSPRGGDNVVDPTSPREGEGDRRLILNFLTHEGGEEYASRGLAFHRLREVIGATLGPTGPKLDEGTPGARVRLAVETIRRLFTERDDVHVLHEPATEQLDQLEEFIAYLDSEEYVPGGRVERDWTDRREYLMGRRGRDGRTLKVGKLLCLRLVELVRATDRWGGSPLTIIDTPWIPTFHNARRADLVLREADGADVMVITALPEPFELEPWVREIFRKRPDLRGRTLVVFNQVDTVDTSCLFRRGGFAEAWAVNVERLGKDGISPENVYVSCARLPFLENLGAHARYGPDHLEPDLRAHGPAPAAPDAGKDGRNPLETGRAAKLRSVLGKIRALASGGAAEGLFKNRLLAACDPADCGVESVRSRLVHLATGEARLARVLAAGEAMLAVDELELSPESVGGWREVSARASALLGWLRRATPGVSERRRGPTIADGRPLFKE